VPTNQHISRTRLSEHIREPIRNMKSNILVDPSKFQQSHNKVLTPTLKNWKKPYSKLHRDTLGTNVGITTLETHQ
jgi:hypothetical protein